MAEIKRRTTIPVNVGGVWIGGNHPIAVQSMTNTDTADVAATVDQAQALALAGSELVRVTVNTREAARAVPEIVSRLRQRHITAPIIGDFHYNGHILLREYPDCAHALDKYRINPGNVGMGRRHDDNFRAIIEIALQYAKPVRIGVNWGSLDQALVTRLMDENARRPEPTDSRDVIMEAMVVSAVESAEMARSYGMPADRIILSAKVSGVQDLIDVYRTLAARSRYALHLGLTEMQRITRTCSQRSVHVNQILHARDLCAQDNAVCRHSVRAGHFGRFDGAHHHGLHDDVAGICWFRTAGIFVHQTCDKCLIQRAPVHPDPDGFCVLECDFNDGPEIVIMAAAHPHVAGVNAVFVQRVGTIGIFAEKNMTVIVEVTDDRSGNVTLS